VADVEPSDVVPPGCKTESASATKSGAVSIGRLKQRRDFLRVAARQCKGVTPGLILQAAPAPAPPAADAPGEPGIRVGFTVSKKVGNAVRRNRARRRLRAVVDALMADLAQPGLDYVVIGRAATVERPFDALLNDLRSAVQRVGTASRGGSGNGPPPAKKARNR